MILPYFYSRVERGTGVSPGVTYFSLFEYLSVELVSTRLLRYFCVSSCSVLHSSPAGSPPFRIGRRTTRSLFDPSDTVRRLNVYVSLRVALS